MAHDGVTTDFTKILSKGEENAIQAIDLVNLMGYTSTRELRLDIANSRQEGQLICSSQKGYFLPKTRSELAAYVNMMESHAREIIRDTRAAKTALSKLNSEQSENIF